MRPIQTTIPFAEAVRLVLDAGVAIERTERIPILAASGRVLAETVTSTSDVPPFDRAAMDGYAVIAEDTVGASSTNPKTLRRIDTLYTGEIGTERVSRGTCIEIATGAPLPEGADAVVMVEETEKHGDEVRFMVPASSRQNIGPRGSDITSGDTVLTAGTFLNPSRVGVLAAMGLTDVDVYARPRVAILTTGNEVVAPGQPLRPGHIYDINSFTLSAVIAAHGGEPIACKVVPDTLADLIASVEATGHTDLLVFSGGSSVGYRDLILDVMRELGEVIFHGVALKPGKPTLLGRISGRPVLGMPGNPTSCLSNAYVMLAPMLRKIARLPEYRPHSMRLPLARRISSAAGRHQIYTVRVADGMAIPAFKGSGDITSMSQADGYIEISAETDVVEAGETVEVRLF